MTPQATDAPFWHALLPRLGSSAEFSAARDLFARCGFDYATLCRRVGVEHLYLLTTKLEGAYLERPAADGLDALLRLFVIGRGMEWQEIERLLDPEGVACLEALQLLVRQPDRCQFGFAPVMALPSPGGAVMVCDRNSSPEGVAIGQPPADALYPALFANTLDFVARFPETPCESILEIGTGTGTAAIQWAKLAREVWATDITPRAVHFAEFNRRLAGADNVQVVEGDLYQPVEGLTFDRIASHPPFVPAKKSAVIFRDGGEDGEQIVHRVVEGLPRFLRPGGLFWASFMISDRVGEPAEQRIRTWLGQSEAEFDIGFAIDMRRTVAETIAHTVLNGIGPPEEVCYFGDLWRGNRTEYLVHASVLIRRQACSGEGSREPVTARTQAGKGFAARHLEWLLDWNAAQREPGFADKLLAGRPVLAPVCELRAVHRLEAGKAVTEDFSVEAEGPLRVSCRVPAWLAKMLVACDGSRSVSEWFEALRAGGSIPENGDPLEFVRMVSGLVSAGVLNPVIPWPAAD